MILVIAVIGVLILGIIVFGGGQVFMPLFKSLWEMMAHNGADIDQDKMDAMFSIANSTPGVVSTKLATFTGYLSANGQWWGWLAMILTYLVFAIPSIVLVSVAYKMISKTESSKYLKNVMKFLRPIVIGILLALSIQLFLGTAFPQVVLNKTGEYIGLEHSTSRTNFFSGWRFYALISYVLVVIPETFFLYRKKVNLFLLIIGHIFLGMIIFQPWL